MHTDARSLYLWRMNAFWHFLRRLRVPTRGERGAVAAEYALLLVLIAIVIAGAVTLFGLTLLGVFEQAPEAFPS